MAKPVNLMLSKPRALSLVRELAKDNGNIIFMPHAAKRMTQRRVTPKMVLECLLRGVIVEGPVLSLKGTWELAMQRMASGERLRVALAIDVPSRLIIITVYDVKD
jgi:Domain of unknown function (DUF4258)